MDHSPSGSSVHGDSLGKNTEVGSHEQGLNPGPLYCRWILYYLSHQVSLLLLLVNDKNSILLPLPPPTDSHDPSIFPHQKNIFSDLNRKRIWRIYVCITESLCCIPKTNITLLKQLCSNTKYKLEIKKEHLLLSLCSIAPVRTRLLVLIILRSEKAKIQKKPSWLWKTMFLPNLSRGYPRAKLAVPSLDLGHRTVRFTVSGPLPQPLFITSNTFPPASKITSLQHNNSPYAPSSANITYVTLLCIHWLSKASEKII